MRPLFKTLAELRESLAVSLGFGAMAGVIDLQIPILNQFLQQAQQQLRRDVRWRYLLKQHIEALGVGQRVLDVPDDAPIGVMFGCSSLSHFAVLQCTPRSKHRYSSCSSLSHFAVLQLQQRAPSKNLCCSSLSHFAVLQFEGYTMLDVFGCSSLSHFAVLQ